MNPNQKFKEEYSAALSQQQRIIKTNMYARELEEKYHKHHHHKPLLKLLPNSNNEEEINFWPIESPVFTEVLKSKLRNLSMKVPPSLEIGKKVLTDIKNNYKFRFQPDNLNLPRFDKSKFWSPPKAVSHINKYKEKEPKEFGPKVKQIHCIKKSSFLL